MEIKYLLGAILKKLHLVFSPFGGIGVTSIVAMSLYLNPDAIGVDLNPISRHLSFYELKLLALEELTVGEFEDFVFSSMGKIIEKFSSENVQNIYVDLGTSISLPFLDMIKDEEMLRAIRGENIHITLHPIISPCRPVDITADALESILGDFSNSARQNLLDIVLWANEYNSAFESMLKLESYVEETLPYIKKVVPVSGFSNREKTLITKLFKTKEAISAGSTQKIMALERGLVAGYRQKMQKCLFDGGIIVEAQKEDDA